MFWHSIWHSIWHIFWHGIWHMFWHSIWHSLSDIYSDMISGIFSDILSDIYSDMIFGIYSNILSGILSDIYSGIRSDILSGILSLTYILTWYLAFSLTYILTCSLAFYLTYILTWYLAYVLTFYLAFYLTYILTCSLEFSLTFYLTYILTFYLAFYLAYFLALYLAVEVQRCPLDSRGPRLRSSGAHWYREMFVEAQQRPLWSGAGEEARRRGEEKEKRGEEKARRAMLKSDNLYLAGGEIGKWPKSRRFWTSSSFLTWIWHIQLHCIIGGQCYISIIHLFLLSALFWHGKSFRHGISPRPVDHAKSKVSDRSSGPELGGARARGDQLPILVSRGERTRDVETPRLTPNYTTRNQTQGHFIPGHFHGKASWEVLFSRPRRAQKLWDAK